MTDEIAHFWKRDLMRKMIGSTAQRLMELEVEGLTGAAHWERSWRTEDSPLEAILYLLPVLPLAAIIWIQLLRSNFRRVGKVLRSFSRMNRFLPMKVFRDGLRNGTYASTVLVLKVSSSSSDVSGSNQCRDRNDTRHRFFSARRVGSTINSWYPGARHCSYRQKSEPPEAVT